MGSEWITYKEAAERLGIKPDSVKKRALRRRWPRTLGNDGRTRIQMPDDDRPADIPTDITPDIPADSPALVSPPDDTQTRLFAAEVRAEVAEKMLEEVRTDRDKWRTIAENLSHPQPLGIVARLFGFRRQ